MGAVAEYVEKLAASGEKARPAAHGGSTDWLQRLVAEVIQARLEEIFEMVLTDVKRAGVGERSSGGVVISGLCGTFVQPPGHCRTYG